MAEQRTVLECNKLRLTEPATFTLEYGAPVLLHAPTPAFEGDRREFATEIVSSGAELGALAMQMGQLVFPVKKRAGGVFAEQIGVGRVRKVDVSLPYPRISKYHAFFAESGGEWFLTDADSTNGTFVGGERLAPKQPARVVNGATVAFAEYACRFLTAAGFLEFLQRSRG